MEDGNEPTAWEEINPAASGRLPALASEHFPTLPDRLIPASPDEMQAELTACLALCGASGMNEDARCEWLRAARLTLEGIPGDLLAQGCRKARATCDHPSKIVPAIMADVEQQWGWRRDARRRESAPQTIPRERRIEAPNNLTPAETEELNQILARAGARTRYRVDGSRYQVDKAERNTGKPPPSGPPRKPTRQDYIDLGVDPAVLDAMEAQQSQRSSVDG